MDAFALAVVRLTLELPRTGAAEVLGRQLLRAGTSVAANYRAACRARSRREFVARLGIVEEEADESGFWMELLAKSGMVAPLRVRTLRTEANELVAIAVSSIRTARGARRSIPHSPFPIPHSELPIPHSDVH
ncbi:MAG TPA: four helix bundle protein [Gemmatimonadales bacterium]|nr:four helix bundle protein [Gemmatimonadales bacterium]